MGNADEIAKTDDDQSSRGYEGHQASLAVRWVRPGCAALHLPAVPAIPGCVLHETPASAASDPATLLPDPVTPVGRFSLSQSVRQANLCAMSLPRSKLLGDEVT